MDMVSSMEPRHSLISTLPFFYFSSLGSSDYDDNDFEDDEDESGKHYPSPRTDLFLLTKTLKDSVVIDTRKHACPSCSTPYCRLFPLFTWHGGTYMVTLAELTAAAS
jgi:hypothetical protein